MRDQDSFKQARAHLVVIGARKKACVLGTGSKTAARPQPLCTVIPLENMGKIPLPISLSHRQFTHNPTEKPVAVFQCPVNA